MKKPLLICKGSQYFFCTRINEFGTHMFLEASSIDFSNIYFKVAKITSKDMRITLNIHLTKSFFPIKTQEGPSQNLVSVIPSKNLPAWACKLAECSGKLDARMQHS